MKRFLINFCRTRLDNRQNQLSSFTEGNNNELFKQGENPQKKFFSKWRLETTKQKIKRSYILLWIFYMGFFLSTKFVQNPIIGSTFHLKIM